MTLDREFVNYKETSITIQCRAGGRTLSGIAHWSGNISSWECSINMYSPSKESCNEERKTVMDLWFKNLTPAEVTRCLVSAMDYIAEDLE